MYDFMVTVFVRVEWDPEDWIYIDWVCNQPELLTNPATGEICKIPVFAATFSFSSRVYSDIFSDKKLLSFIASVVHALKYYVFVPKNLVVPNNPNTAVSKHSKMK